MREKAYKILLLGAVATGKTSLAKRIAYDNFSEDYKSTIGVQLYAHKVNIADRSHSIVLWDTDGDMASDIFSSPYVLGASAAILVCDVQRPKTIEHMMEIGRAMDDRLPGRPHLCVFNKIDIMPPSSSQLAMVDQENDFVSQCSALDGTGVHDAIELLLSRVIAYE